MKQAPLVDEIIFVEKWQSHSGPEDFFELSLKWGISPRIDFGFGTSCSINY